MSASIQELIDKIKVEGVGAAQKKAQDIEKAAEAGAKEIIQSARREAEMLAANAKIEAKRTEESSRTALKQAARDTLLTLHKSIEDILKQVTSIEIKETLTPELLSYILEKIIFESLKAGGTSPSINVVLSPEDLQALKDGLTNKLHGSLKSSLHLRSSDGLSGGFLIGFDQSKSSFDFSDAALAEYLSQYVNQYVAKILKDVTYQHVA